MSNPFLISLIAVSANLVAMLLIYSLLANALARLHWHRRGALNVTATILVAGLFWMITPFAMNLGGLDAPRGTLWFGNWLVLGCSIVILFQRVRWIPRELGDLARMDGCGWFGTYQHIVLPLVRRELGLITLLTALATSLLFWVAFTAPEGSRDLPPWLYLLLRTEQEHGSGAAGTWFALIAGSLVMTLPMLLIFFFAKRYLQHAPDAGGTGSVSTL